ncbi:hypothetical protein [Homoserinimonas sp. A520]
MNEKDMFRPLPGSALSLDDEMASPYGVSHAALHNLHAGVFQLHAAQELMQSGPHRLIAAATLLRSSLEALAVALWVIHPAEQSERIARTLAWSKRNVTDERVAFADISGRELSGDERIADIRRIAKNNGVDVSKVNAGVQSTEALSYADSTLDVPNHLVLYAWRLCSGVAHGRPWALANLAKAVPGTPGVSFDKVSFDEANLLAPFRIAVILLNALVEVFGERTAADPALPLDTPGRTNS